MYSLYKVSRTFYAIWTEVFIFIVSLNIWNVQLIHYLAGFQAVKYRISTAVKQAVKSLVAAEQAALLLNILLLWNVAAL